MMRARKIPVGLALAALLGGCTKRSLVNADHSQQLSGSAYLIAPITKAHFTVKRLSTGKPDELVGEGTTDDKGALKITLPQSTDGDLLVSVIGDQGGSTIEPITGVAPITLSETDAVMAIAVGTHLGDKTTIVINPLTTLVAARTLTEFRSGKMSVADSYKKNVGLFSAHLDTSSPWQSAPIDLMQMPAPGLSSGVIYSLVTLGFSKHALDLGARAGVTDVSVVNTLVLLRALVTDLSDGVFDGNSASAPVNVVGNVNIDKETTRLSLAKAIEDFLDSDANKTGLSSKDISQLTGAMRQDVSELYPSTGPGQTTDPTQSAGAAPVITVMAPTINQTLGTNDLLVGNAFDVDGIGSLSVLVDGVNTTPTFDMSNPQKWLWSFLPPLSQGSHVLQVTATDTKSNTSTQQVSFSFDDAGPDVTLVNCSAPDDRQRAVTLSGAGATYAATTIAGGCVDADLQSGAENFYTFADLYDSADPRTPLINLAVSDASGVASVQYRVRTNSTVSKNSAALATAPSPSTHALSINSQVLGALATGVHAADTWAIDVIATDNYGNVTTRTFQFHLNVLPTPLLISTPTPSTTVSLSSHTFAAGNVDDLFATTYSSACGGYFCQAFPNSLVYVSQFNITNVSSRPISMPTDWASATEGSLSFKRSVLRSYYWASSQAFARNPSGPCDEITDMVGYYYFDTDGGHYPPFTPVWSTQTCKTLAGDLMPGTQTQDLLFTPVVYVFDLPSNTLEPAGVVTLQPGHAYSVVVGLSNLRVGSLNIGAPWPHEPSVGGGAGYTMIPNTARNPLDFNYQGALNSGGFSKYNPFTYSSTYASVWGFVDDYFASKDCGSAAYPGFHMRAIYNPGGDGMNHLVSPVVLERSLQFTSNVTWQAPVQMTPSDPIFVGTGNHQVLPTLASYTDAPSKPNLCPWPNGLCNVDLSGW